ncbi:hypothetical protein FRZ03_07675 [Streptomyces misionensis]|uniref:Uncharacterized protein n=1 Tax=Streptomyces misionensis TaxID=67331 RepID=A0A5C6JZG4_9ACTN|nr:hypothetical protein [Streptomyces misionensis]TWV55569.1 hypothetical protein FRZ03_07675 [Streptomyces misionensis]
MSFLLRALGVLFLASAVFLGIGIYTISHTADGVRCGDQLMHPGDSCTFRGDLLPGHGASYDVMAKKAEDTRSMQSTLMVVSSVVLVLSGVGTVLVWRRTRAL